MSTAEIFAITVDVITINAYLIGRVRMKETERLLACGEFQLLLLPVKHWLNLAYEMLHLILGELPKVKFTSLGEGGLQTCFFLPHTHSNDPVFSRNFCEECQKLSCV